MPTCRLPGNWLTASRSARPTDALPQRGRPAEPGALAAPDVLGHRRPLAKDALDPLPRLGAPPLVGEKARVVVLRLRERGRLEHGGEQRVRPLGVAEPGTSMSEQAG